MSDAAREALIEGAADAAVAAAVGYIKEQRRQGTIADLEARRLERRPAERRLLLLMECAVALRHGQATSPGVADLITRIDAEVAAARAAT